MGCFANRGKGKRKPNLGGRAAGRLNTRDKTRNLSLKEITDTKGPVPIQFELRDKQTVMPLGDHAAYWSSYIGEHWVINPTTGTYNVEKIRRAHPENITASEWDKYIEFWNDPRNIARAAQNRQNRAKSTVISRQGSRSFARLRDEMRQTSTTHEYPSLIDTFFVAHTVNGKFLRDEDRCIYEEMRRLEATSTYTDDEINRLARGGKQRGHIPGVGRVLPARATASPSLPAHESTLNSLHKKVDFMMSLFKSDSKYSDMFSQFESSGASGSGGCGDDEEGADHQDVKDAGFGTGLRSGRFFPEKIWKSPAVQAVLKKCRLFPGDMSFLGDMSLENMSHRGTYFLTEKYVGPTVSLGIVAGERIPYERSPANIPRRQVAGKSYPHQQIARESGNYRWGRGLML
nr:hypothetical protein [Tanacetum cinerariifolium]